MNNTETKLADLAHSIDGRVMPSQAGMAVHIAGIVAGFPVALKAIESGYPFGVTYFLETNHFAPSRTVQQSFKLTITPRYVQGWLSFIARLFLFEGRGQKLDLPQLDSILLFKYDNAPLVKQFAHSAGVAETIMSLEQLTHFNEMVVKSDAGLYLSQPTAFAVLDLDSCKKTFTLMAKIGQILFEY